MKVCLMINGVRHCFYIPIYYIPFTIPKPNGDPHNYPQLFRDASLIGSIHEAAKNVSDERVRGALLEGVKTATAALQERASEHGAEVQLAE
jgi:hypothetical protein